MIPFSNFLNNLRLRVQNNKQTSGSPTQKTSFKNSIGNTVNQYNGAPAPTTEQQEAARRQRLVDQLRHQWLLSNDGISSARMAGLEWGNGEQDWVNTQLQSRGENWKV